MHHFFVGPAQILADQITVTGFDVNHIKNVLRMRIGEQAVLSSQTGKDYLCETAKISSDQVLFHILEEREESTELPSDLFLYQGLPKGDKLELIIQKAVELGVRRVIPVSTRRVVVRLDEKKEAAKNRRWNAVAESAAKQSKRQVIPQVAPVLTFKEALKEAEDCDLKLIPYECAAGMDETRRLLASARAGMKVAVFIGPEGGFDEEEISLAAEYGVQPVTLGRRILRTETAGLCVLSALMLSLEQAGGAGQEGVGNAGITVR